MVQDRRDESTIEKLDRNWSELLQELRVTQTGVQLLTGFLLTLPFQQRFATLKSGQQNLYLADVGLAVASTLLLVAPVAMHRALFRRHQRGTAVRFAHRCAVAGTALFGVALIGVVYLIFEVVKGTAAAGGAGALAGLSVLTLWVVCPYCAVDGAPRPSMPGPEPRAGRDVS